MFGISYELVVLRHPKRCAVLFPTCMLFVVGYWKKWYKCKKLKYLYHTVLVIQTWPVAIQSTMPFEMIICSAYSLIMNMGVLTISIREE